MPDRIHPIQLRWAMATFDMSQSATAAAVGRHPESIGRALRGQIKRDVLSPGLSAAIRAYFSDRGITFIEQDGRPGILGPAPGEKSTR